MGACLHTLTSPARSSPAPPPLPRTNRTSLVPPLVLGGRAASLTPYIPTRGMPALTPSTLGGAGDPLPLLAALLRVPPAPLAPRGQVTRRGVGVCQGWRLAPRSRPGAVAGCGCGAGRRSAQGPRGCRDPKPSPPLPPVLTGRVSSLFPY